MYVYYFFININLYQCHKNILVGKFKSIEYFIKIIFFTFLKTFKMQKIIFFSIFLMALAGCEKSDTPTPTPSQWAPTPTEVKYIGRYKADSIFIDNVLMSKDTATLTIKANAEQHSLFADFSYPKNKNLAGKSAPIDLYYNLDIENGFLGESLLLLKYKYSTNIGGTSDSGYIYTDHEITVLSFEIMEFIPNKSLKVQELRGTRIFKYYFKAI